MCFVFFFVRIFDWEGGICIVGKAFKERREEVERFGVVMGFRV